MWRSFYKDLLSCSTALLPQHCCMHSKWTLGQVILFQKIMGYGMWRGKEDGGSEQQGDATDWVAQITVLGSETTEHASPCIYGDIRPFFFDRIFLLSIYHCLGNSTVLHICTSSTHGFTGVKNNNSQNLLSSAFSTIPWTVKFQCKILISPQLDFAWEQSGFSPIPKKLLYCLWNYLFDKFYGIFINLFNGSSLFHYLLGINSLCAHCANLNTDKQAPNILLSKHTFLVLGVHSPTYCNQWHGARISSH